MLIPAGSNVSIDTHDANIAVCFLDDLGTDLLKLTPRMDDSIVIGGQSRVYSNISHESEIIKSAENIWTQRSSTEDVLEEFDSWVEFFNTEHIDQPDPRVAKPVSIIKENCSVNLSVSEVANSVNLSVPSSV